MASQGKAASNVMPAVTSSQTGASLPPIPPMIQKNNDASQKKSTAVFQGSKSPGISSSNTTNNDVSVLVSQMRSYMEQQERTNQKILREIDEMKKQKKPMEEQSPLVPRVLDFVSPDSIVQQSRGMSSQAQGSSFRHQGSSDVQQGLGSSQQFQGS